MILFTVLLLISTMSAGLPETGVGLSTNETGGLDVGWKDSNGNLKFTDISGNWTDTGLEATNLGGIGDIDNDSDLDIAYRGDHGLEYGDISGDSTSFDESPWQAGGVADVDNNGDLEISYVSREDDFLKLVNYTGNVTNLSVKADVVGGIADIDNDSSLEVAYKDVNSDEIKFIDHSGEINNTGVSSFLVGGIGDINDDGLLEVAFTDSDDNLKYTNITGHVTDTGVQALSVGGMADVDNDSNLEIAYTNFNYDLNIIDSSGTIQNLDAKNIGFEATKVGGIANVYNYTTEHFSSDSCSTISSSGEYSLTSDVSSSSGDCMQINSDDVVLNCQGHKITGSGNSGTWDPRGVDIGLQDNVTIKNCKISDFGRGINIFSPSDNNTIVNNSFDNTWEAIALDAANRDQYVDPGANYNNTFLNNKIYNSSLYGMVIQNDKSVNIINNSINASSGGLVYQFTYLDNLNESSNTSIIGNNITKTDGKAVQLQTFDNIDFKNNIIRNNTAGISFQRSSYNNISNNVIKWNTDCQPNPSTNTTNSTSTNSTNTTNVTAPSLCEENDLSFYDSFNNSFFNNTFTSFRLDSSKRDPNKIIVGDFNDKFSLNNLANVTLENNTDSSSADRISEKTESNLSQMFMAQNFSKEFNQTDYNTSYIVFNQGIGNGTVIYSPEDSGDVVYYPDQCVNNSAPSEAPDEGCYTNTSSQVTLFVPHFSGGAITSEPACIDQDGDGFGDNCELGNDFDDYDSSKYPGSACSREGYEDSTYNIEGECTGGSEIVDNSGESYSSGGGGSIDLERSDKTSSSHSWYNSNKKQFSLTPDSETSVQNLTVETKKNQTSFEIEVEKLKQKPDEIYLAENSYSYIEIDVSVNDDEIQNTSIEFTVNKSFAETHKIVLSRYHNQVWNDLPTLPVDQEGDNWVYEAKSNGFSYYAIRGEQTTEIDQEEDKNLSNQSTSDNETKIDNNTVSGKDKVDNQNTSEDLQINQTELTAENDNATEKDVENEDGISYQYIIFVSIIAIFLVILISRYKRKREFIKKKRMGF